MMNKVMLVSNGIDQHDTDCDCGKCNSNGKSYGVNLYDVSGKNLNVNDEDALFDFTNQEEPFHTEYAASDDSAYHNAEKFCKEKQAEIVYKC